MLVNRQLTTNSQQKKKKKEVMGCWSVSFKRLTRPLISSPSIQISQICSYTVDQQIEIDEEEIDGQPHTLRSPVTPSPLFPAFFSF